PAQQRAGEGPLARDLIAAPHQALAAGAPEEPRALRGAVRRDRHQLRRRPGVSLIGGLPAPSSPASRRIHPSARRVARSIIGPYSSAMTASSAGSDLAAASDTRPTTPAPDWSFLIVPASSLADSGLGTSPLNTSCLILAR